MYIDKRLSTTCRPQCHAVYNVYYACTVIKNIPMTITYDSEVAYIQCVALVVNVLSRCDFDLTSLYGNHCATHLSICKVATMRTLRENDECVIIYLSQQKITLTFTRTSPPPPWLLSMIRLM